jgi:tRNA pseudouridine13 synthase
VTDPALPIALFRSSPADFVVDEVPLYPPSGAGEHLHLVLRKTDVTTQDAVRAIARALDVDPRGVGVAGMKDKRAITTQAATFPFPIARGAAADAAASIHVDGVEVLAAERHAHKLKPGHLAGNRFAITLRGLSRSGADDVARGLADAAKRGVPNAYGPQRFGRDGDNPERALAWLAGKERGPRDPNQQRFLFSALQSLLFNRVLERRVEGGSWDRVLPGDLAKKADFEGSELEAVRHFGGLFAVPLEGDELADVLARSAAGHVVATGPMFGAKMRWPDGAPAALERAILDEALGAASIAGEAAALTPFRHLGEGTRRSLVLPVNEVMTEINEESPDTTSLIVRFVLPKGGYATTVLQRLCVLKEGHGAAREAERDDVA